MVERYLGEGVDEVITSSGGQVVGIVPEGNEDAEEEHHAERGEDHHESVVNHLDVIGQSSLTYARTNGRASPALELTGRRSSPRTLSYLCPLSPPSARPDCVVCVAPAKRVVRYPPAWMADAPTDAHHSRAELLPRGGRGERSGPAVSPTPSHFEHVSLNTAFTPICGALTPPVPLISCAHPRTAPHHLNRNDSPPHPRPWDPIDLDRQPYVRRPGALELCRLPRARVDELEDRARDDRLSAERGASRTL